MKKQILAFAFPLLLLAHGDTHGKEITLIAAVIDTGCYVGHSTHKPDHAKCATACAKAGVPLGLLDEKTGTVYLPIAVDHKNQNEKLMPFIEKKVKVTGIVADKPGMKGIILKTIEEAK